MIVQFRATRPFVVNGCGNLILLPNIDDAITVDMRLNYFCRQCTRHGQATGTLSDDVIMANTASYSSSALEIEIVSCTLRPDFISKTQFLENFTTRSYGPYRTLYLQGGDGTEKNRLRSTFFQPSESPWRISGCQS